MRFTQRKGLVSLVVAVLMASAPWVAANRAQGRRGAAPQPATTPPQRFAVQIAQVKPDMLLAYEELMRTEAVPAYKKAGVPWRWMLANMLAGPGFVRVSVLPVTSFAQYDQQNPLTRALGADGAARYNAKLRTMIVTTETFIDTLQPNLSIQSNSQTPPAILQVQTMLVSPGRFADFTNIMQSEDIPHYRKLGVKDYWAHNRTFGGDQAARIFVRPLSNFAEIDKGPLLTQAIGADAAAELNARRAAMTTASTIVYYRYIPELSYGMPGASAK